MDDLTTLRFQFRRSVEDYGQNLILQYGPAFHRWLPTIDDAIILPVADPAVTLKVWFERPPEGIRRFASSYPELTPPADEVAQRGTIDGGKLAGELQVTDLSASVVPLLLVPTLDKDGEIRKLGKRIARLIHAPLVRFIEVLRVSFGQYWLAPPRDWDSRFQLFADYAKTMQLQWSSPDAEGWMPFSLTEPPLPPTTGNYQETLDKQYPTYITREDWAELGTLMQQGREPSLASQLLIRAYQRRNDLRAALVDAGTAFELAVVERLDSRYGKSKGMENLASAVDNIGNRAKIAIFALSILEITNDDVDLAAKAIEERNHVVHRGETPSSKASEYLDALMRVTRLLLTEPRPLLTQPPFPLDRTMYSEDEWNVIYNKRDPSDLTFGSIDAAATASPDVATTDTEG